MSVSSGQPDELDDLLGAVRDGEIDASAWERLRGMIRTDREVRRRYIEATLLRADLRDRFSAGANAKDKATDDAVVAVITPSRIPLAIAAAILLVGAATAAYLTMIGHATPPVDGPGIESGMPVAVLIDADGTRWDSEPIEVGSSVPRRTLRLADGSATLDMLGGAEVTLHGPVDCTIESKNVARLDRGRLSARITPGAAGFVVRAPGVEFVDLGTAFTVDVDETGRSVLVVTEGRVAATHRVTGRSVTLVAGRAAQFDAQRGLIGDPVDGSSLLNRELIVNGGFEAGPHAVSINGDAPNLAVTGWADEAPGTTLRYEQAKPFGYPDPAAAAMPDNAGEAFYVGAGVGEISQTIEVAHLALFVDAGAVRCDTSAWLGGFAGQDDGGDVAIAFLDAKGQTIGERTLDPVSAAERAATIGVGPEGGPRTGFIRRSGDGDVPIGTRSIRVAVRTTIGDGLVDYYVDNVSLILSAGVEDRDDFQ